jgi:hypothetical protein
MSDGFEDPKRREETIHQAFADAERDPAFAEILRVNYLEKDLACIAHKSLEICERCRLKQQNSRLGRKIPLLF